MVNSNININSTSINKVQALVELYEGSTLVTTCTCADVLQDFAIERYGEDGKFFGSCVSQKVKIELIDLNRVLNITKNYSIKVAYEVNGVRVYPYPTFYVDDVVRNEDDNNLSVEAYDALYGAEKLTVEDLNLPADIYSTTTVINYCGAALGCEVEFKNFSTERAVFYSNGANFNGDETVRAVLKAATEVTQTICYIAAPATEGGKDRLIIKRLDRDGEPVFTVQRQDYFELKTEGGRTLGQIFHTTELGEVINSSLLAEGMEKQYIRNNPFYEAVQLQEDGGTALEGYLEAALAAVGGLTITPFYCDWSGNFLLEPGDKIALTTEDGGSVISYVLNNKIVFDGTYNEIMEWSYEVNETETAANPVSLGEALNKTFAKVDKQAKEIELVASQADSNTNDLSVIKMDVDDITASVTSIQQRQDATNETMDEIKKSVETKVTAEDLTVTISEAIGGIDAVTTSTGFVFNETGLTISNESPIATQITENGMAIFNEGEEVLVADNKGVWAADLHATTYLLIGSNSRLENYNGNRTACFWIGG